MTVINSFKLNGKIALVTGAAGLFGRQIARALGQAGASLYLASRNVDNWPISLRKKDSTLK